MADIPASEACVSAGHMAELADNLPTNMLLSIGMVESGRVNPYTGNTIPWPWTVNVDGTGHFFENKAQAVLYVQQAQSSGASDIDVGCFQVSITYHPYAFASVEQAFDPVSNAAYAASYLTRLKAQTGSWNMAIADYHSAVPAFGLPYRQHVLADWKRLGNLPPDLGAESFGVDVAPAPDPVVIIQSAAARRIHVYTSSGAANASWRPGLPRVYTSQ